MVILLFLLLSLLGESVFSSILKDAGPQIKNINTILNKNLISFTLSTFLSKPENWTTFSATLKKKENDEWLHSLANHFYSYVLKPLYSYKDQTLPVNYRYPIYVADYIIALEGLHGFYLDPHNRFDDFFNLWINILNHLNVLRSKMKDENILKFVKFDRLPTATAASIGLLNAFIKQIDAGFPPDCDQDFFKKLDNAVDRNVSNPEDTSGPASVPDVSLNSSSQSRGNGPERKDTSSVLFSSIVEDAVPQIEKINEIISITPTTSALSTFLSDKENWTKFSEALKNVENKDWLLDLSSLFEDKVVKYLFPFKPKSKEYPPFIKGYLNTTEELANFKYSPFKVDEFFRIWIDTLGYLKKFPENASNEEVSNIVELSLLQTADVASDALFTAFKEKLEKSPLKFDDTGFLNKLKIAAGVKISNPEDTSGPASVPDVSLNFLLQSGGKVSKPEDSSDELLSSILEDARPLIDKINEIIGVVPKTSALSTFLSDKEHWTKLLEALKNVENKDWLIDLSLLFGDKVIKYLFPFKPKIEGISTIYYWIWKYRGGTCQF